MSDALRVCSIIFIVLGIIASPLIYLIEAFFESFHFLGFLLAIFLGLTQLILLIVFCTTKNVRTIFFFVIVITVITLFLFIIDIYHFSTYLEHERKLFHRLIDEYPDGRSPDSAELSFHYLLIVNEHCYGIDDNTDLSKKELTYFLTIQLNQISSVSQNNPSSRLAGQPCMTAFVNIYKCIKFLSIVKMLIYGSILLLVWIYLFTARRRSQTNVDPNEIRN